MNLETLLAAAGESSAREAVGKSWHDSQASFSEAACRKLLAAEFVKPGAEFCGFTSEEARRLADAAGKLAAVPGLERVFWHCVRRVYFGPASADLKGWPAWQKALGDAAGAFYLLVGLAGVSEIRAAHQQRGTPENVTRDTCRQLRDFSANHERGHAGQLGLYAKQLPWMRNYVYQPYYRLGRMEYWLNRFAGGVRAYRHRRTGHVLALAEDGRKLNGEGYVERQLPVAGASENREPTTPHPGPLPQGERGTIGRESWVARLVETDDGVTGFPYSPAGMAVRQEVHLARAEWEPVLRKDTWVLDMHIPAGGSMGPEATRASHELALEFFDRHHGDQPWAAMVCNSWIFNTQLEHILPPEANLVRYLRDLYLYPVKSTGQDGLWFVFLQEPLDLATAPRESSLQKAILKFLEAGNVWRGGAMFMLREHARLIGEQHYRKAWPAALAAAGIRSG